MNLWERRKKGSLDLWGVGQESVRTQCFWGLLFPWEGTIHVNWKAEHEDLKPWEPRMGQLWLSLALVLVVSSSSKTHGSPWRNLAIIVRRVEEHLLTYLEGQCSSGTSTSKGQWKQQLSFRVSMEARLAIFSSLGYLYILSEVLGSLNMGRLKTRWSMRRRTPLAKRWHTHWRTNRSQSRGEWMGEILSRGVSKNEGLDLIERWHTEHLKELRKIKHRSSKAWDEDVHVSMW